jgi:hypothetical protein
MKSTIFGILMSPVIASPQNSKNVRMEIHLVKDTKRTLIQLLKIPHMMFKCIR